MRKKNALLLNIMILVSVMLNAQQNHFVFIQADNKKPFSVKVNNKSYSSSPNGYVIIPKLIEGKYNTMIAFPGDKFPEQQFFLLIDKKDLGFSLKNFEPKGWGLFNLQTFAITMNGEDLSGTDVGKFSFRDRRRFKSSNQKTRMGYCRYDAKPVGQESQAPSGW